MPRIVRTARPTKLDQGDLIRQMQALDAYDRARRSRRFKKAAAMTAVSLIWVGIWVAVLYHAAP